MVFIETRHAYDKALFAMRVCYKLELKFVCYMNETGAEVIVISSQGPKFG